MEVVMTNNATLQENIIKLSELHGLGLRITKHGKTGRSHEQQITCQKYAIQKFKEVINGLDGLQPDDYGYFTAVDLQVSALHNLNLAYEELISLLNTQEKEDYVQESINSVNQSLKIAQSLIELTQSTNLHTVGNTGNYLTKAGEILGNVAQICELQSQRNITDTKPTYDLSAIIESNTSTSLPEPDESCNKVSGDSDEADFMVAYTFWT